MNTVKIKSYAKVNLTLDVTGRAGGGGKSGRIRFSLAILCVLAYPGVKSRGNNLFFALFRACFLLLFREKHFISRAVAQGRAIGLKNSLRLFFCAPH